MRPARAPRSSCASTYVSAVVGVLLLAPTAAVGVMMPPSSNEYQGRGRGRGRAWTYFGPAEFDDSWWSPPPPVGPDPFLRGYSAHVYPRYGYGFGGMPYGGYGAAHHFWGGASYHMGAGGGGAAPFWRGSSAGSAHPRFYGQGGMPYSHPRDSFGMGYGGTFPLASPYYFTPPPMQGDWNLPKNPPPPPGGDELAPA